MGDGKVMKVTELGEYQEDSIVSRTLVDRPSATVTFFAFWKNQRLREHSVPFDALLMVLEGEMEVTIAGEPFRSKRGNWCLCRQMNRLDQLQGAV